jgi:hypothetical protein
MALTCGFGKIAGRLGQSGAVECTSVRLSAVLKGALPQLCPSEISERTGRARLEQLCGHRDPRAWSQPSSVKVERRRAAGAPQ